jgi:hypothetical protein
MQFLKKFGEEERCLIVLEHDLLLEELGQFHSWDVHRSRAILHFVRVELLRGEEVEVR